MTKDELIYFIKTLPEAKFQLEEKLSPPGDSFDIPDPRTYAIYPPSPHRMMKYRDPHERNFNIKMLWR